MGLFISLLFGVVFAVVSCFAILLCWYLIVIGFRCVDAT